MLQAMDVDKPATIEAYLDRLPEADRAALEAIRAAARSVAPDAVESISYDVPTLKYRGRPLVYFAAYKKHLAMYGVDIAGHADQLAGFETSKGTIRFTAERPLPEAVVRSLVVKRKADIEGAVTKKRSN
jgi:uncharacterized protein YdhG (YjbR/CyaY superfamily)